MDEQIDIYCKEIISHGRVVLPRYLAALISVTQSTPREVTPDNRNPAERHDMGSQ